jgi:hypothetical protein
LILGKVFRQESSKKTSIRTLSPARGTNLTDSILSRLHINAPATPPSAKTDAKPDAK